MDISIQDVALENSYDKNGVTLSEILEDFYGCEVEVDGRYFHLWAGENAWRLTSYKGITLEQKEFLNSCSIF